MKPWALAWILAVVGVCGGYTPRDTDVLHQHLELEIDPVDEWIGGSHTITVCSRVDGLGVYQFRLSQRLPIGALTVGGTPVPWAYVDSITVEVTLDRVYDRDEVFEMHIAYSGKPRSQGSWGSIVFRERGGAREVYTMSCPWFAYTWWPAKEDLQDKATADLWFTVPDDMVVASNGVLMGVDPVGLGQLRYRWETDSPIVDYLICFDATNYTTFESRWDHVGGSMPLQFFIYPEADTPENRAVWLRTGEMLTTFSDLFGAYPFSDEKYGIAQFGWGGGMEHQTMTFQTGFQDDITAHELSHQWWGDSITCATWHDVWLNEGFATYSEALWYENQAGSPGAPALHAHMAARRPGSVDGTVYVYDVDDMNRVYDYNLTYLKAAWVVHMLRWVVGTDAFYDILAAYRAEFDGRSATTEDLQRVAENVSGRELDWFFWQWIYQRGAPRYRYGWVEHDVNGAPYVELNVRQSQSFLYPVFTMPIEIEVTTSAGVNAQVVWNDARLEHLLLPVDQAGVTGVTLDPRPWVHTLDTGPMSFAPGPPKVVGLVPRPAENLKEMPAVKVTFHKPVQAAADDFELAGVRHGSIDVGCSYDPPTRTVTLTPLAALLSDTYTLTVADTILDVESQQRLDGELAKPFVTVPLPSGDGLPGGALVTTFAVVLVGDVNCDNEIGDADISPFVKALANPAAYAAAFPGCPIVNADINEDGRVDFGDINPFIQLLSGR